MGKLYTRGEVYWLDYRANGQRIRRPAGTNHKEAQAALDRIVGKIASDDYKPDEQVKAPSFDLAVDEYIRDREAVGKKPGSYLYLEMWVGVLRKANPASISTQQVARQLDRWQIERKWSNATRNRAAAQLSGFLSFAIRRRWIRQHPMERGRIPRLEEPNGRTRWLRRHEIEAVCAAADRVEGIDDKWRPILKDVIVFAAATGIRLGRLCDLRRSDYEDSFIVIDRDKNGERVHIPVADELKPLVERGVERADFPGSYLFPGPTGTNARASIRRWLPRVVRQAGLRWGKYLTGADGKPLRDHRGQKILDPQGVTIHTLRHSFASNAFLSGVPDSVIQRLGNWKTGSMLDRYRHHADEQLREAAGRVAACVAGGHNTVTAPRKRPRAETERSKIACDTKPVSHAPPQSHGRGSDL